MTKEILEREITMLEECLPRIERNIKEFQNNLEAAIKSRDETQKTIVEIKWAIEVLDREYRINDVADHYSKLGFNAANNLNNFQRGVALARSSSGLNK